MEHTWESDGAPLDWVTMHKNFSYRRLKTVDCDNLWDSFTKITKDVLFPEGKDGPLCVVRDFYKDCLNFPIVFWDIDKDANLLLKALYDEFDNMLESEQNKGNYRSKTSIQKPLDDEQYGKIVANIDGKGVPLNTIFNEIINKFLEDNVYNMTKTRLEMRCDFLKKRLNVQ